MSGFMDAVFGKTKSEVPVATVVKAPVKDEAAEAAAIANNNAVKDKSRGRAANVFGGALEPDEDKKVKKYSDIRRKVLLGQ